MKKLTLTTLIFISSLQIVSANQETWIDTLFSDSSRISYRKEDVDSSFLRQVTHEEKIELSQMTNPGQKFNATDVVVKGLPRKRLILIAQNKKYRLISYEQGGRANHIVVLVYEQEKIRAAYQLSAIPIPKNATDLKKLVQAKNSDK